MTELTFLGTGNFLVPDGRYWNSFVIDGSILVEPAPTSLPHLRRVGLGVEGLDVIAISHFHPDHTFGWPFLLLEIIQRRPNDQPLWIVGPPGVREFLAEMMELGGVPDVQAAADRRLALRFVELDGSWHEVASIKVRGIEVDHVPHLRCFGFLFDLGGRVIGYSGDTRPCAGLNQLAGSADALVLECNGKHSGPPAHMDEDSVRALRDTFPDTPFVLSHLGSGLDLEGITAVTVPEDFQIVTV